MPVTRKHIFCLPLLQPNLPHPASGWAFNSLHPNTIIFQEYKKLHLVSGIVCSYAFALPVATAPNAIVFGHSSMKTTDMMKAGFVMNLICVITLVVSINSYAVPLFGLDEFPDWAQAAHPNASLCFPWVQVESGLTLLDMNEGCELRRIWWYGDSLDSWCVIQPTTCTMEKVFLCDIRANSGHS